MAGTSTVREPVAGAEVSDGRVRDHSRVSDVVAIVALTGLAVWLRLPALDPGSLWLDDAWVALVGRARSATDVARIVVAAPLHTVLVWLSSTAAGGAPSELAAQLPAWTVGVATPGLAYGLVRRLRAIPAAALLAGAVVAVAPVHILYSSRVKSYTLDALLTIVLLYLAVRVIQSGTAPRWRRLAISAIGATVATSVLAIVSAGALGGPALVGIVRGGVQRRRALASLAAYAAAAGLWWVVVLRRTVRPGLTAFWADRFIPRDDLGAARSVATSGARTILDAVAPLPVVVTAAILAVALLLLVRRHPGAPLLVVLPVGTAFVLAVLHAVPWGGGRTDTYLVGVLAVALGLGADAVAPLRGPDRTRRRGRWAASGVAGVLTVALVGAGLSGERPGYPAHDVRAFVERVDTDAAAAEPVIVYPATRWAFALYTDREVTLVDEPSTANGFEPVIEDTQVTVLPPLRATPEAYRSHLEVATAGAERVWFVASHWSTDMGVLRQQMDALGFAEIERDERRGAALTLYERR